MAVNRLCSSGLQGNRHHRANILLGDCDYGVGGGVGSHVTWRLSFASAARWRSAQATAK